MPIIMSSPPADNLPLSFHTVNDTTLDCMIDATCCCQIEIFAQRIQGGGDVVEGHRWMYNPVGLVSQNHPGQNEHT